MCSKSIKTEAVFAKREIDNGWDINFLQNMRCVLKAVFTKTEMNNEWNVNLLQNMRCMQKVLRLKLYLSRQKWTMDETLIFFS